MATHPTSINGKSFKTVEEAAVFVARMRYDQAAIFIDALAADLREQAAADKVLGRARLAKLLNGTSDVLRVAGATMHIVWELCEPHMKEDSS